MEGDKKQVYNYGRCLRNHAAWLGGHATDGCCDYAQGAPDSPFCLACDCHKNYHEKTMIKVDNIDHEHNHNESTNRRQITRGQLYMNSLVTNKLRHNASTSSMAAKVEKAPPAQESSSKQLEPKNNVKTKGGLLSFSCMKVIKESTSSSTSPAEDHA